MWGSDLLQKPVHYRGNPVETAAGLNVKLWGSVVVTGDRWRATLLLQQPSPHEFETLLKGYSGTSCWFMLMYFAPCRPLPRPHRPLPPPAA
jgi:hypothetical protein